MPLIPTNLQQPFLALFSQSPAPTAQESAAQMAKIYYGYASQAFAPVGAVVIPPTAQVLLQNTLYAAMAVPLIGLPVTMATAWGAGVAAFWLGVTVTVPPAVGAVIQSATATALIIPGLTALFLNPLNTSPIAAAGMAAILDAATRTVTCTVAPPPGTVLPLT